VFKTPIGLLIPIFFLTCSLVCAQSIPNYKVPLIVSHLSGVNKTMLFRAGAPKHNALGKVICFNTKCRGVIGWRHTQQRNKFKGYKKGPSIPRLKYLKNDSLRSIEKSVAPVAPGILDTVLRVTPSPIRSDSTVAFTFDDVVFDTNKSDLKSEFIERLDSLSVILSGYENYQLQILGHTDNSGAEKVNTRLSQERADAVASYLVSTGISRDVITAKGMGSSSPIADNNTVNGRQKNRRVEVIVSFH
jgi:outer membrane protein OmpA-like peptidoglycan-associated protein